MSLYFLPRQYSSPLGLHGRDMSPRIMCFQWYLFKENSNKIQVLTAVTWRTMRRKCLMSSSSHKQGWTSSENVTQLANPDQELSIVVTQLSQVLVGLLPSKKLHPSSPGWGHSITMLWLRLEKGNRSSCTPCANSFCFPHTEPCSRIVQWWQYER